MLLPSMLDFDEAVGMAFEFLHVGRGGERERERGLQLGLGGK